MFLMVLIFTANYLTRKYEECVLVNVVEEFKLPFLFSIWIDFRE